eukprot:11884085-Prorocentrum_lima.AAC.1
MTSSLVGSEMCIRDSKLHNGPRQLWGRRPHPGTRPEPSWPHRPIAAAVSYTHLTLPTICSV